MRRLFDEMEEIKINLDKIIKSRNITSKELANRINITEANLSILKTGNICRELDCQPGDIFEYKRS